PRTPAPLGPEAASSRRISGWGAPDNAGPGRPPSPALAAPPAQSSLSAPHRSFVLSSVSSSAPSNTERRLLQLRPWSYFPGPLHRADAAIAAHKGRGADPIDCQKLDGRLARIVHQHPT